MGSFPAMFAAHSRNKEYPDTFLHSAEVVTCTHRRSTPCSTTGRSFPSTLPWCGAQSVIRAITVPSRDLANPPFCGSNFGSLPSLVYTLLVADLGILVLPDNELPPPVWLRALGNTGLGTLPPSLPQSIIDRQNRGIIRGIPPIPKLHAGRQLLRNGASVDMC
jgi:hypothetical protein